MTGRFNREIKSAADPKGLQMRIPGLAGNVYARLGVDVKLLPAIEIFPALDELASKDGMFKKVMESYFAFKKDHDCWADRSEGVWHAKLRGA
jgi:TRAP-type mannitol/chloroaromatic compound transport system substrate-binding protein